MSDLYMKAEENGKKIEIYNDNFFSSPRIDFENLFTFHMWDRNIISPDKTSYSSLENFMEVEAFGDIDYNDSSENQIEEELKKFLENNYVFLIDLRYYSNAGDRFYDFYEFDKDNWHKYDGIIYVSKDNKEIVDYNLDYEKVKGVAKSEVETYQTWANGYIYGCATYKEVKFTKTYENGVSVIGSEWEIVESCGGFYGSNWNENGVSEFVGEEFEFLIDKLEVNYN